MYDFVIHINEFRHKFQNRFEYRKIIVKFIKNKIYESSNNKWQLFNCPTK